MPQSRQRTQHFRKHRLCRSAIRRLEGRPDRCIHLKALEVSCIAACYALSEQFPSHGPIACLTQVLGRWQQLSLLDIAARQPNDDLIIVADDDVLLVQSVPLQDRHDGVSAVMLVEDSSLDAAVDVKRSAGFSACLLSSAIMSACQNSHRQC